jgi:hypothetical protein
MTKKIVVAALALGAMVIAVACIMYAKNAAPTVREISSTTVSLAWVGHDAKQRGRNPRQIVILCFISWPVGFLIWRSLRPPPAIDSTAWARLANRPVAFRFPLT